MRRFSTIIAAAALAFSQAGAAFGGIVNETFEYTVGDAVFEGVVSRNSALEAARGTVLLVHDWDGIDEYEIRRAEMLAAEGYVGVVLDLFGRDAELAGVEDYQRATGQLYGDRALFQARLSAGIAAAAALPSMPGRMVLAGYCFGGAAALEAARADMGLAGYVSFHGGLGTPEGQGYDGLDAPVLLLHGTADPVSGMADLAALLDGLEAAGVPHRAEVYGGARHAFTVWGARDYDLEADRRSWRAFLGFLDDAL
ncbi:dienelactone hydrolase family protein [Alkalilacustris brevis]|uniref:dienelactone hydrolase family protein n=1 Tax=Alkalilacustris brevis TaxID=2026338 RepID=UPI000E0D25EF|nr:dienelactone hydrolase family protein [Alkalilacustris brevis]